MVAGYGDYLAVESRCGRLSAATAQNYLSAVNRVLEIIWGDKRCSVLPVQQSQIPRRKCVVQNSKAISASEHLRVLSLLSPHLGILMNLQREFGLRFEESAKLNAVLAHRKASKYSFIEINEGTKGGRVRFVPIVRKGQLISLQQAAEAQEGISQIPSGMSYKKFRDQSYNQVRQIPISFHGERHFYAQRRYRDLCGAESPVVSGHSHGVDHWSYLAQALDISLEAAKTKDKNSREVVAAELGHNRVSITNYYLG